MERIVNRRLCWILEHDNILTNAQCGFRRNRSTTDHILAIDSVIRAAFEKNRHVGAVFFDIEAAYDTTWRQGILLKLHKYGIRGHMGTFIKNFLTRRRFKVRVGGHFSDEFIQVNGVPQGGVLSVSLFAIMINDIGDTLPQSIGRSLFVDDFAIWSCASSTRYTERQLQLAISNLERWCMKNGFLFSTSKTTAVHFCRRRQTCTDMELYLRGQPIPVQPAVKFLGVVMDRKLTYKQHLTSLRDKCFRALNILRCVARTSYGADRCTLLMLYRSLIRSKLDYACFIYDSACHSNKKPLDTIHHTALRIATGAFRTTPIDSLLAEVNEPPLALRRQRLGLRYVIKLRQFPSHPTYNHVFSNDMLVAFRPRPERRCVPLCLRIRSLVSESHLPVHEVMQVNHLSTPPWRLISPAVDISLSEDKKDSMHPEILKAKALEHISSFSDHTISFTDGSKGDEGVGCAFVCGSDTRSFTLPRNASVFTSELMALIKLLCYIEASDDYIHLILTDSLSSLMGLRQFYPSHPLVQDILIRLTSLYNAGKNNVMLDP